MQKLQTFLDQVKADYHRESYLASDPLEIPHRFSDPLDQEAVALLCAVLAYGNVKQIRRSAEAALERMLRTHRTPREFVRSLGTSSGVAAAAAEFRGYVHRFNPGGDLVLLFQLLAKSWSEHGSLGAHFLRNLSPTDETITEALDHLIAEWKAWASELTPSGSFHYLLTAPRDGSCCKRWCMFLRWMGRHDRDQKLDLGLWGQGGALSQPTGKFLDPAQLVIPLDTHTGRISQYLGLTDRKSLNWLAAREVTRNLKFSSPRDPTGYDFALARLGILNLCQKKYRAEICGRCALLPVCRFAARRARGVRRRKAA